LRPDILVARLRLVDRQVRCALDGQHHGGSLGMSDDYVYDEATGEWLSPAEAAAKTAAGGDQVLDSVCNVLQDGDSVTLIKDLAVKGAGQTLKRGTVIKSIRLTSDDQEIDCRHPTIKGLVLRAEFVRKA